MKITKESLKRMIIQEFGREMSTQDMMPAGPGAIMSGFSQSEVTVIVETLTRMNKAIAEDETLSSIEIQEIVNMIKDSIIPAVNTLSDTINRKYREAYPESGE
jgi:hypothetical protein